MVDSRPASQYVAEKHLSIFDQALEKADNMKKKTISVVTATIAVAMVLGAGVAPASAADLEPYRSCSSGRHHYAIVDQTGFGSITMKTSGEVLNIVKPALVRGKHYKHGAQTSGYVRFNASTTIHSAIIECSL